MLQANHISYIEESVGGRGAGGSVKRLFPSLHSLVLVQFYRLVLAQFYRLMDLMILQIKRVEKWGLSIKNICYLHN
jgi:hypothetical protein